MEPQQPAHPSQVRPFPLWWLHHGHDCALGVRGDALLLILLAYRGPLHLLHQLPALGEAKDLVCFYVGMYGCCMCKEKNRLYVYTL